MTEGSPAASMPSTEAATAYAWLLRAVGGKFGSLLIALVALLLSAPLIVEGWGWNLLLGLFASAVLLAGLQAARPGRRSLRIGLAARRFRREHRRLWGIFLIPDGGASHIAAETADSFAEYGGWWRPRFTPVHASWLNQGELLNHAFGRRYLKRGSWSSREEYIAHVNASWPKYNRLYAHPFEWTWTNYRMRRWFAEHSS